MRLSSAPLLPESPNLLFTNAGMNQFVPYFLGDQNAPYKRAADTQKCIRAGVSIMIWMMLASTHITTHFRNARNWSFGDYFKKEAISGHGNYWSPFGNSPFPTLCYCI